MEELQHERKKNQNKLLIIFLVIYFVSIIGSFYGGYRYREYKFAKDLSNTWNEAFGEFTLGDKDESTQKIKIEKQIKEQNISDSLLMDNSLELNFKWMKEEKDELKIFDENSSFYTYFTPDKGTKFIYFNFDVENKNNKTYDYSNCNNLTLVDSENREFQPFNGYDEMMLCNGDNYIPALKHERWLVFSVPENIEFFSHLIYEADDADYKIYLNNNI